MSSGSEFQDLFDALGEELDSLLGNTGISQDTFDELEREVNEIKEERELEEKFIKAKEKTLLCETSTEFIVNVLLGKQYLNVKNKEYAKKLYMNELIYRYKYNKL